MNYDGQRVDSYDKRVTGKLSYWKHGDAWFCELPGEFSGNLSAHKVDEHEDGTITVRPSILITKHTGAKMHGYITRGAWEGCADSD